MIQDANLKPIGRDAVRVSLFFFLVLKNRVESGPERERQLEGKFERRRIFARFECDDGLACHTTRGGKLLLREIPAREPQCAYLIANDDVVHRRARAYSTTNAARSMNSFRVRTGMRTLASTSGCSHHARLEAPAVASSTTLPITVRLSAQSPARSA